MQIIEKMTPDAITLKNRPYSNVATGPYQPCFLLSQTIQAVSTVEAEITLKA